MVILIRLYRCVNHSFRAHMFADTFAQILLRLTFTTLLANSADDKLVIFFLLIYQKTDFDISCKLSPLETICMKYQNLFSGKNKKNISNCRLLKIYSECKALIVKLCRSKKSLFHGNWTKKCPKNHSKGQFHTKVPSKYQVPFMKVRRRVFLNMQYTVKLEYWQLIYRDRFEFVFESRGNSFDTCSYMW